MGFVKEFKEFLSQGNVMELAVAVIIAGAFQKIIDSLVNDIIMPLIAMFANLDDIKELKEGPFTYGNLLAAILYFIIVAFVLFVIIKGANKSKK